MFSGGIYAVVAADAVARYVPVIESSRYPGIWLVTVVAVAARLDVVRRLARRYDAVVTRTAAAGHSRMIHEEDRCPRRCRMAVRTDFGRRYVVRRPDRGSHRAALRVTGDAGGAGILELAACVTALAAYVCVGAVEYEAGTEMIEWFLCFGPGRQADGAQQGEEGEKPWYGQAHCRILTVPVGSGIHWIDLTSRNDSAE